MDFQKKSIIFAGFVFVSLFFLFSLTFLWAAQAKPKFTIEQILSYPFCYSLVSAKKADRIAWVEVQKGKRNLFTAAAPDFKPQRLTNYSQDDGIDLMSPAISDDGSIIVYVRGHNPNRQGWVANPASYPEGVEQAIWAVRSTGGKPFRIAAGSNPVLSPDGQMVLWVKDGQIYGVALGPIEKKGGNSPEEDAQLKPLFRTQGTNSNPVWSPDSKKIAFVSDREDHSFIGVFDLTTKKIIYLSPSVDRDTSPTWSPDGQKIAFIRRPGYSFSQIIAADQARATTARTPGFVMIPPTMATPPGERRPTDQPAQTASGPGFVEAKFADGRTLTFWVADLSLGTAQKVWHEPLDDPSFRAIRNIVWAGKSLVFQVERNNWRHYYSVPVFGDVDAQPVNLTPGEGETEFVAFSSDGEWLYYSTNVGDIDRRHLWKTPTAGGKPIQLTSGEGIETEPVPLGSNKLVATFYSDARRPRSVALVPVEGGTPKIITSLPSEFPLEAHVIPQPIILTAEDGLKFHNQLFLPPDLKPGEKRPALIFLHGGPVRQMLLGYHYLYFYHMAYAINQYFANQGYVVISVNFRSGIGYGRDFRMAPNRGAQGASEYQDIIAAARYLQSRPDVDPERIGLWGLSYGGYLTALGLARNSDIFRAGVDMAGVHLWGNNLDINSLSFKSSPIGSIDKWTSPVLLIHGDDDRNVAFSQTTGLVQLLRARNIPHELIVFPDEVHVFLIFENWLKAFRAADDFLARKLKK
ncbi:MAG: prolyl oligopeptidase family serine peptidase [Candidatus Aminicenantes bacterium]|nr:prolyl oligopeptidase family serine peptidase [Candidatus Aminicenantes bacterium]